MAASLMHKGQERNERIGLRVATFLKRCGRDPETGQLLTLTGKKIDETSNLVHLHCLELHKKRQARRHQWTPRLPRHHDAPENSWHVNLQDEDADIVFEEFRLAVEASFPETRKWYEPPTAEHQQQQQNDGGVQDGVSPMSAVGFVGDDEQHADQFDDSSPTRPGAMIDGENDKDNNNNPNYDYYSPSAQRPRRPNEGNNDDDDDDQQVSMTQTPSRGATTTASSSSMLMTRKNAHKLLAAVINSSSSTATTSASPRPMLHRNPNPNDQQDYQRAVELSDVFLAQDTTHHISFKHLKEDNKAHRVKTSQIIRGDGLDKITCGIPPNDRRKVQPGRVEIVLPAAAGQSDVAPRVVSRLVSQKQLQKEKLCHGVDFVAKYRR